MRTPYDDPETPDEKAEEKRLERAVDKAKREAAHAEQLLQDPLLTGAFQQLDDHYMRALRYSNVADTATREEARRMLQCLDELKAELHHVVMHGKLSAMEWDARRGEPDAD